MESTLKKKKLFWDVNTEKLFSEQNWYFIIERILEFGDIDDYFWMKSVFKKKQINNVIKSSRGLSSRTCSFCKAIGYEA